MSDRISLPLLSPDGSNMTGTFPEGILHLPFLQSLSMAWGQLEGPLPKDVVDMKHLANIELHYNAFTGEIPEKWYTARQWQRINIAANQITGQISPKVRNFQDLKGIYLYENLFTGEIPTELGELKSLTFIRVQRNLLKGNVPTELGRLSNIISLWIHENDLSGSIPRELGFPGTLEDFRVHDNARLGGELPAEIFKVLDRLDAFNCDFKQNLTDIFPLMTELNSLRIHNNKFSGQMPENMGEVLVDGTAVWLSGNDFTGTVPHSLCRNRGPNLLRELVADCNGPNPEIECSCCSECCDRDGGNCLSTAT